MEKYILQCESKKDVFIIISEVFTNIYSPKDKNDSKELKDNVITQERAKYSTRSTKKKLDAVEKDEKLDATEKDEKLDTGTLRYENSDKLYEDDQNTLSWSALRGQFYALKENRENAEVWLAPTVKRVQRVIRLFQMGKVPNYSPTLEYESDKDLDVN